MRRRAISAAAAAVWKWHHMMRRVISVRLYTEDPRDIVHDRYVVGRVIGRGSFGQVIVAYDLVADRHVALKVIKRSETFYKQALKVEPGRCCPPRHRSPTRTLHPRFLSSMASYDVASNIYQADCPSHHRHAFLVLVA
jgi:serine/threonine protein kinase